MPLRVRAVWFLQTVLAGNTASSPALRQGYRAVMPERVSTSYDGCRSWRPLPADVRSQEGLFRRDQWWTASHRSGRGSLLSLSVESSRNDRSRDGAARRQRRRARICRRTYTEIYFHAQSINGIGTDSAYSRVL